MSNWLYRMEEIKRTLHEVHAPAACGRFQIETVIEAEKMLNDLIKQYLGHEEADRKLIKDKKIAKLEKLLTQAIASFKEIQADIETAPAIAPDMSGTVDMKFYGESNDQMVTGGK